MPSYVFTLTCQDRPGIVAATTAELAQIGANIVESNQFWDETNNLFFMRIAFSTPPEINHDGIELVLRSPIARFGMETTLCDRSRRPRIVIMVSAFDHVLLHLIYQIRVGWLNAEIAAIVSNHESSRRIAEIENLPFHYLSVSKANKLEREKELLEIFEQTRSELVVLARYMQVFSDTLSAHLSGRAINIHHSFLPSFKGARPYQQAFDRGVKLIGATAHYVSAELDEGPIIEQETERVGHSMTTSDFVAVGRDIESRVLARAVKLHLESRVMLSGHKTVVF